uniref:Uncharacterized protein n=1 Tax=Oryza nivara TaxID=4536 RepID=A0A0E0J4Q4_ORYNI
MKSPELGHTASLDQTFPCCQAIASSLLMELPTEEGRTSTKREMPGQCQRRGPAIILKSVAACTIEERGCARLSMQTRACLRREGDLELHAR